VTAPSNSTPDRSAQSAKRDPFLALANEIERNRWWVDSSGKWELPPEENDGLRTPAGAARKPRKPRRPSISKMIEEADKAGKPLASITMPDGTKLDFGKPESVEPDNAWPLDEFRRKGAKR
jgi:hypothetical protein